MLLDYLNVIENRFDSNKVTLIAQHKWYYSFYISVGYVVTVFALRRYMRDRERYNLRVPLFMWSLMLALFSIVGSARVSGPMLRHLMTYGWESSVCGDVLTLEGDQIGLWAFLFCFSKLPELIDTYFIVLRKQKLIFLHWYHHVTVFIYCWYHFAVQLHPCQWFITLNYAVHAIMYSYYAIRASGRLRPPIWVNMVITVLQILQMIFGVSINLFIYTKMSADSTWYCDGTVETSFSYVYWSFAMYFSYFVLFAHFFWSSYFCKSPTSKSHGLSTTVAPSSQPVIGYHQTSSHANGHTPSALVHQCNGLTKRQF